MGFFVQSKTYYRANYTVRREVSKSRELGKKIEYQTFSSLEPENKTWIGNTLLQSWQTGRNSIQENEQSPEELQHTFSLFKYKSFNVFRIWSLDCLWLNITEQVQSTMIKLVAYALLLLSWWLCDCSTTKPSCSDVPQNTVPLYTVPSVPLCLSPTKSFHHRLSTTSVDCQWNIQYLILQRPWINKLHSKLLIKGGFSAFQAVKMT